MIGWIKKKINAAYNKRVLSDINRFIADYQEANPDAPIRSELLMFRAHYSNKAE